MSNSPYNLTICQNESDWEFNNQCPMYIASSENVECNLTIDKNYSYGLIICNTTQDKAIQTTIDYIESNVCPEEMRSNTIYTGQSVSSSLEFTPKFILAPGQASNTLNLNSCVPTSELNLTSCKQLIEVSGKNYNHNLNLCNDINPQLYSVPHKIQFHYTIDWSCNDMDITFNTGENVSVILQGNTLLPVDINYSGETSYLNSFWIEPIIYNSLVYIGEYSDCDLEDNPFDNLEPVVDTGEYSDCDFYPTKLLEPVVDTGEYSDCDLEDNPFDNLEPVVDTGEYSDCDFENAPQFNLDPVYSGEYSDCDFENFASDELEPVVDTGEYCYTEELYVYGVFDPVVDTGEYGDCDLEDNPSKEMLPEVDTGEYCYTFDMATTFSLYPIVSTGESSELIDLNLDPVLIGIVSTGEYSFCDLTDTPPVVMNPIVSTGEDCSTIVNTTLNLHPRIHTGEYTHSYLTTWVSINFILDSMISGESVELVQLDSETEYYDIDTGEYSDCTLNNIPSLISDGYTGEYITLDDISLSYAIDADGYTGEQTLVTNIYVHPGEELEANCYTGEYTDADSDGILTYPVFLIEPINSAQAMYDGLGGAGGLNFCEMGEYNYDASNLVIDARSSDREPWGKCGPQEDTVIYVNLTGNVRLEADVYVGENTVSYIPEHYTAFSDMGEDEYILYNLEIMPDPIRNYWTFEPNVHTGESNPSKFMFLTLDGDDVYDPNLTDNFDIALSLPATLVNVDLEVPPMVESCYTGESVYCEVTYDEANWKYPFKQNRGGQCATFTLEANEYIRFCPGYLIPEGNSVVFDFASEIKTNCKGYFTYTGESTGKITLNTTRGLGSRQHTGENGKSYLNTYPYIPWDFRVSTGENSKVNNGAELRARSYTGEQCEMYMPRRQAEGYTGELGQAFLEISLPSVIWTSPDGCVPNVYNPLTPDGDFDKDYENYEICIEDMPYVGKLKAECTNEFIYHKTFHLNIITNNISSTLGTGLAVVKHLSPTCYSGENSYIYEWNINTGESFKLELNTYIPVELESIINTDENITILDFG